MGRETSVGSPSSAARGTPSLARSSPAVAGSPSLSKMAPALKYTLKTTNRSRVVRAISIARLASASASSMSPRSIRLSARRPRASASVRRSPTSAAIAIASLAATMRRRVVADDEQVAGQVGQRLGAQERWRLVRQQLVGRPRRLHREVVLEDIVRTDGEAEQQPARSSGEPSGPAASSASCHSRRPRGRVRREARGLGGEAEELAAPAVDDVCASGTASDSSTARSRCFDASTNAPAAIAAVPAATEARSAVARSLAASAWCTTSSGAPRSAADRRLSLDAGLQRPDEPEVIAPPLAGQQVVVHGLLEQRVAEGVARPSSAADQHLGLEGGVDRGLHLALRRVEDGGQMVESAAAPETDNASTTGRAPSGSASTRARSTCVTPVVLGIRRRPRARRAAPR